MKPAEIAKNIKDASHIVAHLDSEKKNKVLYTLHDLISKNTDYIISENKKDILNAEIVMNCLLRHLCNIIWEYIY